MCATWGGNDGEGSGLAVVGDDASKATGDNAN